MRILLDENIPRGVRRILAGHDVRTVPEMGWTAYSNGQSLDEAERAGFEPIVTGDRNFVTRRNLRGRKIAVVVLSTNTWPLMRAQPQTVQRAVASALPGALTSAIFAPGGRRIRARSDPALLARCRYSDPANFPPPCAERGSHSSCGRCPCRSSQ